MSLKIGDWFTIKPESVDRGCVGGFPTCKYGLGPFKVERHKASISYPYVGFSTPDDVPGSLPWYIGTEYITKIEEAKQ